MPSKTYHGSCHCGAVRFEADIDLAAGTVRCNCTLLHQGRATGASSSSPPPSACSRARTRSTDYQFGTLQGHHLFCRRCGIHAFSRGDIPEIGGAFVSVQLASLDDATPAELIAAPIHVSNGRDNDWMHPPPRPGTSDAPPASLTLRPRAHDTHMPRACVVHNVCI